LDFTEQFCPKNKQLSALTKLEGTGWYQGKDLVEDYIDHFQELIDISGYSDSKTIVVKFWRGLDPSIQSRVALLGDSALDFYDQRDGTKLLKRWPIIRKPIMPYWRQEEHGLPSTPCHQF